MVKLFTLLFICSVLIGCDRFPGPVLRNEFPGDIKVTVTYDDGTRYSDTWASCLTVSIGSSAPGKFGMKETGVEINQITVEFNKKIVIDLDKESIQELVEKAQSKKAGKYWILNQSGVSFSANGNCSPIPLRNETS